MNLSREIIDQMNGELRGITDKVKMHGKNYVMVKDRLSIFRRTLPDWSIVTQMEHCDEDMCIIKATIANDNGVIVATGYAQEFRMGSNINKTSYVENGETSAIGRALANLGIGIDDSYASGEEVIQAEQIRQLSVTPLNSTDLKILQTLCEQVNQDMSLFFAYASKLQGTSVEKWEELTYASYGKLLRRLEKKAGNM